MRSYHSIGKVFGIEIGLHVSWYLIFILATISLGSDYFPRIVPNVDSVWYFLMGLSAALLLFVSVLLHELAHCLVARSSGVPIDRIFLFFFGGISQIDEGALKPRSEMLMAAAGPLFSIILGYILWLVSINSSLIYLRVVLDYLARLNIMLGLFNLLPAFPLDGGRILRGALWLATGKFDVATYYASLSGRVFGSVFALIGCLSILFGDFGGFWLLALGVFIFFLAESSFENVVVKKSLGSTSILAVLESDPLKIRSDVSIASAIDSCFVHHSLDHVAVVEGNNFFGVLEFSRSLAVKPALRRSLLVSDVMIRSGSIPPLQSKDSLYLALERMSAYRIGLLPVYSGSKFIGIVSRESLVHYLRSRPLTVGISDLHHPHKSDNHANKSRIVDSSRKKRVSSKKK